jgi:hypothetical protein
MLGQENGCFDDIPVDLLWSVVPKLSEERLLAITEMMRTLDSGILQTNGWRDFVGTLGKNEHSVYDIPVTSIVNAIISVTHQLYGGKEEGEVEDAGDDLEAAAMSLKKQRTTSSKRDKKNDLLIKNSEKYTGPRLVLKCDGNTTHVSEVPVSSKPDGSLSVTHYHRQSLAAEYTHKKDGELRIHTEDVLLSAQFKVSTEVRLNP